MPLEIGDVFSVIKLDTGFVVKYPVSGLPEKDRPELCPNEPIHTRLHQKDRLAYWQVCDEILRAFDVQVPDETAKREKPSPGKEATEGQDVTNPPPIT